MAFFSNVVEGTQYDVAVHIKILFISASDVTAELTALLKEETQASLDNTTSFQDFFDQPALRQNHYNGVLVDLLTYARFSTQDKELFLSLSRAYPVCLVRKTSHGSMCCFHPTRSETSSIEGFLLYCHGFGQLRPIRRQRRYDLNLNLSMSKVSQASILADRIDVRHDQVVTLNVSEGGAYILTSGEYSVGDIVNLSIPVLGEKQSIRGEIRWVKGWDTNRIGLPGIGVQFMNISARQRGALEGLLQATKLVQ